MNPLDLDPDLNIIDWINVIEFFFVYMNRIRNNNTFLSMSISLFFFLSFLLTFALTLSLCLKRVKNVYQMY